ncbi:hypothetical protein LCGC14_3075360, partial [marine sediment metagenome]
QMNPPCPRTVKAPPRGYAAKSSVQPSRNVLETSVPVLSAVNAWASGNEKLAPRWPRTQESPADQFNRVSAATRVAVCNKIECGHNPLGWREAFRSPS